MAAFLGVRSHCRARLESAEEAEKRVILQQITRDLTVLSREDRRAAFEAWDSRAKALKVQSGIR